MGADLRRGCWLVGARDERKRAGIELKGGAISRAQFLSLYDTGGGGAPAPAAPPNTSSSSWACTACTFANPPTAAACEMCGGPAPAPAQAPPARVVGVGGAKRDVASTKADGRSNRERGKKGERQPDIGTDDKRARCRLQLEYAFC
eukprot:gene51267-61770_t